MANPGIRSLRLGRASLAAHVYLVTTICHERRPFFADFEIGRAAARAMTDERTWDDARLLAWVLMPDHWHGLVQLGIRRSLSQVIQRLKANSARIIRQRIGAGSCVWQAGFHDRRIRSDRHFRCAADYLLANPLRAGLVEAIGDYSFWGTAWRWEHEQLA